MFLEGSLTYYLCGRPGTYSHLGTEKCSSFINVDIELPLLFLLRCHLQFIAWSQLSLGHHEELYSGWLSYVLTCNIFVFSSFSWSGITQFSKHNWLQSITPFGLWLFYSKEILFLISKTSYLIRVSWTHPASLVNLLSCFDNYCNSVGSRFFFTTQWLHYFS